MLFSLPRLYLYSPFWQKAYFHPCAQDIAAVFLVLVPEIRRLVEENAVIFIILTQILTFVCVMNLFLGSSKPYTPVWVSVRYLK